MKKILLVFVLALIMQNTHATIWLVNNNPNPQSMTSVQLAIDTASAGDTIMVEGSTSPYGSITIAKPIVIFGEGYNDALGENVVFTNIDIQSSNVYLSGLIADLIIFNGTSAVNDSLYHVTVERCFLHNNTFQGKNNSGGSLAYLGDINIRNNIVKGSNAGGAYWVFGNGSDERILFNTIVFENNIFTFFRFGAANPIHSLGQNTVLIRNNLFMDGVPNNGWPNTTAFYFQLSGFSITNAIISNNIFYGSDPTHCDSCTYMNNIAYNSLNGHDSLTASNNNLVGDPLFVFYPGGAFDFSHNYHLQQLPIVSPCIGTGVGGTDMGIYGGYYPFLVGEGPKIPVVDFLDVSKYAVPQGSSLFLEFNARVRK